MPIEIKNLTFSYSSCPFMENIDLVIPNGQFVGIIGKTGCGKTTLVELISGLVDNAKGSILIDGKNILDKKYKSELRKKIGIVFQFPEAQLFGRTVEKDLMFGIKHCGLSKKERNDRIRCILDLVGMDYCEIKDKSPFALSQGEKRKVALAGVLVRHPEYLILDESVAGLDPLAKNEIMQILLSLKEKGTTIIMVSHNADFLSACADRIIVMDNGSIIDDDTPFKIYSRASELAQKGIGSCTVSDIDLLFKKKGIDLGIVDLSYDSLLKAIERNVL